MNKKILLTLLLSLIVVFSISSIQASDVNITDSDTISSDDENVALETSDDSQSVNSNTLSTNEDSLNDYVKNETELTSNNTNVYYRGPYSVTLKDLYSNDTLSDKEVNFQIDNVNYTSFSDANGVASVNLTLTPGKYSVLAYFSGDEMYMASNNLTTVIDVLSTVKANDMTKYYKANTPYTATFYDSSGNPLINQDVVISVNGKTYTKKTDNGGVASLDIDLQPGTYKVISTDPLTGYKLTTNVKVLSTISASSTSKVIGDGKKFSAKFFKSNGEALANTYIKFKIKGKTYKVKTNSNGVASLSLKNLKKGTYKVVCYNKDGLTKTVKVKVCKKVSTKFSTNTYTYFNNDNKVIKVTLSDSFGSPASGKSVKITINKKTYKKKTNSKGEVSLKLPSLKKGVYTIKYKFGGTSHYKASSASSKVAIIDTSDTSLSVKSTRTFGHGASTPFKVAVTAGGVALIKKTVTFKVDNRTYTSSTDDKGIASLPIKLDIGNYTITYSIDRDSKVNGNNGSCDIIVKQRINSKLTWKSGSSFKGSTQKFKVLLTDMDGKALAGKSVKLTINSKTYTATTASNGYATFKVKLSIGEYDVSVKFAGCNDYAANSTSKTVDVTVTSLKNGINQKNTISVLKAYLKSSKHCQVGNSKIKKLVAKLTKGLTSEYDKAKAIFNYVKDVLSYSFYYNTKYGAKKTLSVKRGNCVDHTHLLVAMFRTAGLASRYVHGKCTFSSGGKYGHVWAQVLIGDTWVCADATSSRNSLGKIANWNTKSFTLKGKYSSLPF